MMPLADRLRGVLGPASTRRRVDDGDLPAYVEYDDADPGSDRDARPRDGLRPARRATVDAADVLGGVWDDRERRRFAAIERAYPPGHRHGRVPLADVLPPDTGWSRLHLLAGAPCGPRLLFLDLETTGLAGGAGTQAFLVGCAWFDRGTTFRVRQFLLTSPTGERAMLEAVTALAGGFDAVVTYNGKSFDLPLLETRFLYQRLEPAFGGMPHVDMLHAARRLWKADPVPEARRSGEAGALARGGDGVGPATSSGCRLTELEHTLCGHRREDDVSGFEIPARYFHFVRTGDAWPLAGVVEHNRLDLIALAHATARAAQLLDEGPAGARTVREAFGLGRLYERGGHLEEARASFAVAAGSYGDVAATPGGDVPTRAEAFRALAVLARRARRHDEAARAWQAALALPGCPAPIARAASEALAVHHEHRRREWHVARRFALQSLACQGTVEGRRSAERRLARLGRKLAGAPAAPGLRDLE